MCEYSPKEFENMILNKPHPCMEPDSIRIKRFTHNMKRDAYREELKNILTPSEEFDSMAAKITQPFSIDKAIHG